MPSLPQSLIDEIKASPLLQAALHHRSARGNAKNLLLPTSYPIEILGAWESLGMEVVAVYAAQISFANSTSAASASLSVRSITQTLHNQLSSAILSSKLYRFGNGVTDGEKKELVTYTDMALRLVGAIANTQSYSLANSKVLEPISSETEFVIASSKDSKTQLQEICQSRKTPLPKYELIETRGSNHDPQFLVRVSVPGKKADAVGGSKRAAEQNAAETFLLKYYQSVSASSRKKLIHSINYVEAAGKIGNLPNRYAALSLARRLALPDWSVNLLSLAFTHASHTNTKVTGPFGKDNKLLAFFGSHVLQWVVRDALLKELNNKEITDAGGIGELVRKALNADALAEVFDNLLDRNLLLLGRGESQIATATKIEFLQAFCGALYLARDASHLNDSIELFKMVSSLHTYLTEDLKKLAMPREKLLPAKTLLQEYCQAIDIGIKYETKYLDHARAVAINTAITLQSPWMKQKLHIVQSHESTGAHVSPRKSELEAKLATSVIDAFDIAAGRFSEKTPDLLENNSKNSIVWLLEHTVLEAAACVTNKGLGNRLRVLQSDILGTSSLREGDFGLFQTWHDYASQALGSKFLSEYDALLKYYTRVSQNADADMGQNRLAKNLAKLESLITSADPLSDDVDLRSTLPFQELAREATSHRLMGSPIGNISVREVVAQAKMLLKQRAESIFVANNIDDTLLEIQGAHMALVELLLASDDKDTNVPTITMTSGNGVLDVTVKKNNSAKSHLQQLTNNPVWPTLRLLLPILKVEADEDNLILHIPSVINSSTRENALRYWWSYHRQGSLGSVANDTIATMLHDLKNDILAYATVAQHARAKTSARERYQLAADAVRNLEQAISTLSGVRALTKSTTRLPMQPVTIGTFIKSVVAELWSWLPSGVHLVPPTNMGELTIWSNQDRLHSIIINLARNAVEAMSGEGRLEFEYVIDSASSTFWFEIGDTGPGFSDEQLKNLNRGTPTQSSKKNGQGIGLLTVLLLTKELNGEAEFRRRTSGGSTVIIGIPSVPPPEIEVGHIGIVKSRTTEDRIIEDD